MTQLNPPAPQEFIFNVKDKKSRKVIFVLSGVSVSTSCDCGQAAPCEHALYVAAGRKNKMSPSERSAQKNLIRLLGKTEEGRAILHTAQLHFDHEMTCRVCESERVIDTKKSWLGPLYRLFMPRNLRYHCRRCGWNW